MAVYLVSSVIVNVFFVISILTGKQCAKDWMHVPLLVRYLSRNLIGSNWLLVGLQKDIDDPINDFGMNNYLLAVSEIEAKTNQGKRDTEPHDEDCQHSREWHSARRAFTPDEKIENQRNTANNGWIQCCRL